MMSDGRLERLNDEGIGLDNGSFRCLVDGGQ